MSDDADAARADRVLDWYWLLKRADSTPGSQDPPRTCNQSVNWPLMAGFTRSVPPSGGPAPCEETGEQADGACADSDRPRAS